jgi:drug/metabolite transporter (DMT)-like permease
MIKETATRSPLTGQWGALYLVGAAFCLGWIGIFVNLAEHTPPTTIVLYRVLIATTALGLVTPRKDLPLTSLREGLTLLAFGLLLAATYLAFNTSYTLTRIANAAFLHYLSPVFVLILAYLTLRERVSAWMLICLGLGIGGAALLTGSEWGQSSARLGDALAVGSAVTYASYTVLGRVTSQRMTARHLSFWAHAFALPFIALYNLLGPGGGFTVHHADWPYIVMLALFSTALPFTLTIKGLQHLSASRSSLVLLLSPVTASLLGWLVLRQSIGIGQVIGIALVVTAATLASN